MKFITTLCILLTFTASVFCGAPDLDSCRIAYPGSADWGLTFPLKVRPKGGSTLVWGTQYSINDDKYDVQLQVTKEVVLGIGSTSASFNVVVPNHQFRVDVHLKNRTTLSFWSAMDTCWKTVDFKQTDVVGASMAARR